MKIKTNVTDNNIKQLFNMFAKVGIIVAFLL